MLHAASQMVRERGVDGVTVPEVMATAGLTHGGFYRHFDSKDALVAQACAAAFTQRLADMDDALETTDNADAARRAWLEGSYLSPGHRDSPENGCAAAALAGDVARAPDGAALRDAYLDGLKSMIEKMERLGNRPADPEAREQEVLVELATAVGAVVLSRAIAGDELSERLLTAARRHLIDDEQ
ncbi:TetR/AcrR family transcriptional regulator [Pseudonocardia sp. DSM 110487]|uniref:TetR/AcrR family transcriptional regulator n=1 Tax=Pseudonocardia sp. DSM 110487 TaxID=2865833 RepID=UPI001C69537E|nr:TetR/AcrR family transcriptional regulator [Pseudonocardia sp. DSM 110487]QYN33869.1 TetR/AcrR family transcriptional regulator [Pseudonocardia sp. DSM 110487]